MTSLMFSQSCCLFQSEAASRSVRREPSNRFTAWLIQPFTAGPQVIFRYLVEVFPGEEGLVVRVGLQQGGEGAGLFALLPGFAAAVALQRVVGDPVVVGVLPRQDAGSAGAAQRTGHELK